MCTQVPQSVIPISAVLFIIAELLDVPQIMREASACVEMILHE